MVTVVYKFYDEGLFTMLFCNASKCTLTKHFVLTNVVLSHSGRILFIWGPNNVLVKTLVTTFCHTVSNPVGIFSFLKGRNKSRLGLPTGTKLRFMISC